MITSSTITRASILPTPRTAATRRISIVFSVESPMPVSDGCHIGSGRNMRIPMQLYFSQPPETQTLVDDESGRIIYRRDLFDQTIIAAWFEQLRDGVEWRSEERPMYDRIVAVPRLVASFKLDDPLPEPIARMVPDVEAFCKARFTSAGLNLYRDGDDSVAPHGDRLEPTPEKAPVALV